MTLVLTKFFPHRIAVSGKLFVFYLVREKKRWLQKHFNKQVCRANSKEWQYQLDSQIAVEILRNCKLRIQKELLAYIVALNRTAGRRISGKSAGDATMGKNAKSRVGGLVTGALLWTV